MKKNIFLIAMLCSIFTNPYVFAQNEVGVETKRADLTREEKIAEITEALNDDEEFRGKIEGLVTSGFEDQTFFLYHGKPFERLNDEELDELMQAVSNLKSQENLENIQRIQAQLRQIENMRNLQQTQDTIRNIQRGVPSVPQPPPQPPTNYNPPQPPPRAPRVPK
jgi:hypothetical protein